MNNLKKRILVAEDEDALRNMIVMVLKDEGYQVDAAANGNEAWELMNTNHYDLLATDLYMPQMNGIELIFTCQEPFPETKIILFSGGGKELDAEHGNQYVKFLDQEIKVDVFLKKPCDLGEMLSVVKKLLQE